MTIEFFLEPLRYPFMLRGLAAASLVGAVCAVVGTFVVLRGMAFYGSALAHTILPGVAVGYLIHGSDRRPLFWWSLFAAIISSVGIGLISQNSKLKEDTAIGVIFAAMFALGIGIISTVRDFAADLTHFLFGDVLSVSNYDLAITGIFSAVVLLVFGALYKELVIITFDKILAKTLRLPARFLEFLLLGMIALTIVISLQTVGIALMSAMLITPAASAFLLVKRIGRMILLAVVLAVLSGISGLYVSFYLGIASGAAIVLVASLFFSLAWMIKYLVGKTTR